MGGQDLISVFHLKNHQVKNLDGIARATKALQGEGIAHPISIIGGGSDADIKRARW
jgi:hypothetical protein